MTTSSTLRVQVPGDKSLTHRALMFAAAARGESRLSGLLIGADCQDTASILRALGASIPELPRDGGEIRIQSDGLAAWHAPEKILDCGNSGTTVRLMMGLLAGRPFCSTLTGDASLRSRPMRRVTDPLSQMGARVRELESADRLPVELCGGPLRPLSHRSPKASAQIKSALLLAGLSGEAAVELWEPGFSRDHTERIMRSLGVQVEGRPGADGGWEVSFVPPEGPLPPLEMAVPGDPSSAAFILAVALLSRDREVIIPDVGINPTRTGFLGAVARMGAQIEIVNERESGGEPVADLVARPAALRAIEIGGDEVPSMIDELPVLAVLAARAEGETVVRGAEELRAKESDRISAMVGNLRAIGVDAEELPDGFVVTGTDRPLQGRVRTYHDHRIAMAFGVLNALPGADLEIEAPEIADVSFPGFWELVRGLGGGSS